MKKLLSLYSSLLIILILSGCDNDNAPTQPPGTWTCGNPIEYEGKICKTIQIGDQCWLRENLNIGRSINADSDASDNGIIEKYCFNDLEENCDKVGGLYKWNEAMQYTNTPRARGICPSGWYIPTIADFQTLLKTVNYNGDALMSQGQGSGTNTSGFSALLSGFFDCVEVRYEAGSAFFWSSEYFSGGAFYMALYPNGKIELSLHSQQNGFSVRCLKDTFTENHPPNQPSKPNPADYSINVDTNLTISWSCTDPNGDSLFYDVYFGLDNPPSTIISSNQVETNFALTNLDTSTTYHWMIVAKDIHSASTIGPVWNFTTKYVDVGMPCPDVPTVFYESITYNTVQIGSQCWLKANLDVGTMILGSNTENDNGIVEKYCYNNDRINCNAFGGLYQWDEAMQYTTSEGTRGICPPGWHIPTIVEFDTLRVTVGDNSNALKAIGHGVGDGAGTNASGFSALLAGYKRDNGDFANLGFQGRFWSSTENGSAYAYGMSMYYDESSVDLFYQVFEKALGLSVRCIRD